MGSCVKNRNGVLHREQENKAAIRKRRAWKRKYISDQQSPEERLATLNNRLGIDVGATKERARLKKLLKST